VETVRELGGSALVEVDLENARLDLTVTAPHGSGRHLDDGRTVVERVLACGGMVSIDAKDESARLRVGFPQLSVMAQTADRVSGPKVDLAT
jgi:hypothetical protein